ncbi:MAG: isocitrate lyase [Pseudomonadota bacterium]
MYNAQTDALAKDWKNNPRWQNVIRPYSSDEVVKLRPSIEMEYSFARHGSERLWHLLNEEPLVNAFGALNGSQAVNMVKAGLKSIYISGWQVAADANLASQTYPDQSLYPANSVPTLVRRINNALMRADQIEKLEGKTEHYWYLPILADAEAGFGGPLHAFELMKAMVDAGAAAMHFEDQLAAAKKCGHMGGKVLIPTSEFKKVLSAARLAADICNVPSIIVARTDAYGAKLLTSDIDEYDKPFINGSRTAEGFFRIQPGIESAISRALAYAPLADMLWFETSHPNVAEAQVFAEAIHKEHPGKFLAYNCSPSFNWEKNLNEADIASFQKDLSQLGYKYQFITLAGWHLVNYYAFDLACNYRQTGMSAYVDLQRKEFASEHHGYTATRHQREVGTNYFDQVLNTITQGKSSTTAMEDSTEHEQFDK